MQYPSSILLDHRLFVFLTINVCDASVLALLCNNAGKSRGRRRLEEWASSSSTRDSS